MFSFLCQLRLEKLKSSARHEKICPQAWVWGVQVLNFKAGITIGRDDLYIGTSKNIDVCIQEIPFYYLKKKNNNYNL